MIDSDHFRDIRKDITEGRRKWKKRQLRKSETKFKIKTCLYWKRINTILRNEIALIIKKIKEKEKELIKSKKSYTLNPASIPKRISIFENFGKEGIEESK